MHAGQLIPSIATRLHTMTYEIKGADPAILRLSGEVNLHEFRAVRNQLTQLMETGTTRLIVNMSSVTSIDSSSIGTLFSIREAVSKAGGRFLVAGMSDSVRTVMQLTNIIELFEVAPNEARAIELLAAQ